MRKKLVSLVLAMVMLLTAMPGITVFADEVIDSGTCGDNLTWVLTEDGKLTISGTGEMDDYSYSKTPWFSDRRAIKSVIIKDGVTSIGDYAFGDCDSLTSITISDSVTSIGDEAFRYCDSLTSITIPDSVTSIGDFAFYGCRSLTSTTIPDSVTSIGICALEGCSSLTSITIPDSVTSIGSYAFRNCRSLTSITIPDSVTSIGGSAFSGCSSLTSITIPDSVMNIGYFAFKKCSSLEKINVAENNGSYASVDGVLFNKDKSTIVKFPEEKSETNYIIPESVTSIGVGAFYSCSSLTSITIPDSVTYIGSGAFEGCDKLSVYYGGSEEQWKLIDIDDYNEPLENAEIHFDSGSDDVTASGTCGGNLIWSLDTSTGVLTITGTGMMSNYGYVDMPWYSYRGDIKSVVINDGVTSIGDYAFWCCKSLTSITIGNSVTSIGYCAFSGCSSLEKINVSENNENFASVDGVLFNKEKSTIETFPAGKRETNYIIPDSVTYIGRSAFEGCSSLTSITIPDSVTSIGGYAFQECSSLTSITIPDSVTSIGDNAFRYCSSLTSITIPDSVTSIGKEAFSGTAYYKDKTNWENGVLYINNALIKAKIDVSGDYSIKDGTVCIAARAFNDCGDLTSITIPDNVTSIGDEAFGECGSLTRVTIGNSVTSIGDNAFWYCSRLTSITIGNSVTYIGVSAFQDCSSLTSITIPDSVTSIGYYAFRDCSSLTSVTIGNSVTSIGGSAFSGCHRLTSITIPDSVTSIGDWAFSDCSSLTSITIPDSVTSIGSWAFQGCSNLTSISIPSSVTGIGLSAFKDCTGLTSVNYNAINSGSGSSKYPLFENCTSLKEINIGEKVTNIPSYAFQGCSSLTSISIPDSVTRIGEYAFKDCTGLTSVNYNAINCTSMGSSYYLNYYPVFENCTSLKEINIGEKVTNIPSYAFYGCSSLTSVNYNAINCTSMGSFDDPVFENCTSLKEINIGEKVTNIPSYAFYGCSNLTIVNYNAINCTSMGSSFHPVSENCTSLKEINIGEKVTNIPSYAFCGCSGITSISIPDSVTSIGESAFSDCSSLTSITIGNGVTSIGGSAFESCSSLTSITIPDGVTSIEDDAFIGCRSLTNITIPDSVTSIGGYAFRNCSSLTSITIPGSVTSIGSYTFSNCSSLTSITIGNGVTIIGYCAFDYCSNLTDVYYIGSEADWAKIRIDSGNESLTNATIHYAYGPGADGEPIINEERFNQITFRVVGYPEDELVVEGEPIENAVVTFRGTTKKTDASGSVTFYKNEFVTESGGVCVTADGYWDYDTGNLWAMPLSGVDVIPLTKKDPEKIYITGLSATGAAGKAYDLKTRKDFSVDKIDTAVYKFKVNVDWNGHKAGRVYLKGDKSGKFFEFVDGEVSISPGAEFEVGENVRAIAQTADGTKTVTEENLINVIALPEEFSLVIPQVIDDTMSSVDFMGGRSFQLGFDTGIEKFAGKVEVVDGKLVIEFSGGVGGDSSRKKGRFEIFDGKYIEVEPHGKIEVPLAVDNTEWSGTFGVEGKADPIVEWNWNKVVFIPQIGAVPVTATVSFSGGVSSDLIILGDIDNAGFGGKITPSLTFDAFGGLGADYDTVVMKAGVYLNAKGELEIVCHTLDTENVLNPSLEGEVGVRAKIKVWFADIEGEKEFGKFRWNKDGFKAAWFEDDASLLALENDSWQLSGREYLENGGGFVGGNNAELFDLEVTNKDERVIYNNIFDNAEAVLQNIDDRTVLVYTVDDTEREEQNGLKLVYSEKLSDGTWSEPIAIDDDGTLDSIISADEKFVVWEDMKSELSDAAMSMKDIFAQTEISAAYFDGENWISTQLTSNDTYDFSPTVKTNGNKAIATWLSNTESDFTSQSGTTNIHYATFDGTSWSEITTIENVGTVTRVTAAYNGDTPYIFYKKDGSIHSVSAMDGKETTLSYGGVGQYAVDTFNDKIVLAYFDANGNLKVSDDAVNSSAVSMVTTEAAVNSIPVIAANDTDMYVGWIDHQDGYDTLCGVRYENGKWSDKITFVGEEANVSNPSLVANDDGTFSASYFKTGKVEISESGEYTTGAVDLCVNNISPSYNLAIDSETLSYDDEMYTKFNTAAITFDVKNVGEKSVSGFDVEIYENDELKKTISKTTEIKAGATASVNVSYTPAESGKIQELQIKVVPSGVDDFDESDNIAAMSLGAIDAAVTNAYFTKEGRMNYINAVIKNNGSAIADSIIVSVHKGSQDGEVIYQTTVDDVLSCEELLVKAEIAENNLEDTSLFFVTAETQNDVNEYNNNSMAVKENKSEVKEKDIIFNTETKTAVIKSDKEYENVTIFFAAYKEGKLVTSQSVEKDLAAGENTAAPEKPEAFSLEDFDTVKVYIWENSSNMKPLFTPFVVKLTE